MSKLTLSGLQLNLTTVTGIIQKMDAALLAVPEVVELIETAISVFSADGKEEVQNLYQSKMAASDQAHEDTQEVLQQRAEEAPPSEDGHTDE